MIYLAPVRWESYAQRPHFMIRHFLACGGRKVLWINPYPGRLPRLTDLRRTAALHKQGTLPEADIEVVDFRALPIDPLPGGFAFNYLLAGRRLQKRVRDFAADVDCLLGIGKPSRLALLLLRQLAPLRSFYDAMDDFPKFHRGLSRAAMARTEERIAREVDHLFVSSGALQEKFAARLSAVTCVPNAFDPETLPFPRGEGAKEVLGYVGALGEWFDWPQLIALALAVPTMEVRLVGPCLLPPPRRLPANIRILPPCRHDQVGEVLRQFRVGLIPFRDTPLTAAVDPIKYYEYRAMGLPVISSRFGEMRYKKEEGLFYFEKNLADTVAKALAYRSDPGQLLRWRLANSWKSRFVAAEPVAHCLSWGHRAAAEREEKKFFRQSIKNNLK